MEKLENKEVWKNINNHTLYKWSQRSKSNLQRKRDCKSCLGVL